MILVGLGANLPSARYGSPVQCCEMALNLLNCNAITVRRRSRWYRSAPVPAADQPNFVNGVVEVATGLDPASLLARLHGIEAVMGRTRSVANAPRVIDLDLIDYHGLVLTGPDGPILPHPRAGQRAFVLLPLREVASGWRHPVLGLCVEELIEALPTGQDCSPLGPLS